MGGFDNSLLRRKEVKVRIESDVTPSRVECIKILAKEFACSEDCIHILRISGNFGTKTFTIVAHIYDSKKDKDEIARSRKRDSEADAKIVEENKPKEEPKEEVKEESSSEETPKEEAKE